MNTFEASSETVNEAAEACARRLAKWFGGAEEAAAAMEADPIAMMEIALVDFMKERRALTLKVHMNPRPFTRLCAELIQAGGKLPNLHEAAQ